MSETGGKKTVGIKSARLHLQGRWRASWEWDENWNDITTWSCSLDTRYVPYANPADGETFRRIWEISEQMPSWPPNEWFQKEYPENKTYCQVYDDQRIRHWAAWEYED